MNGFLDWYLLGVVAGLGVAAGAVGGRAGLPRGGSFVLAGAGLALAAGAAVVVLALPLWAFAVLVATALAAAISLRGLSSKALPAAFLSLLGLAIVPALGYAAPLAAPLVGQRIARRADSRYAGLRVLAKD